MKFTLIGLIVPLALLAQVPAPFGGGGSGGGGGGISGLTTNVVPKALSATTIGNSSITDNGTTVATTEFITALGLSTGSLPPAVTPGTGGVWALAEGTVPSVGAATGVDICYGDSTAHGVLCSYNNASFVPIPTNAASTTVGHYVKQGSTNGTTLTDGTIAAADLPAALSSSTSLNGVTMGSAVGNATIAQTVATGATAMGTSAIASGACATTVTATATGGATTDVITASPNADPTGVTGYAVSATGSLYIVAWVTSNTANFKVCNNTSGSLTPSALTMNWRITR